eukprot:c20309_g1_i3.p1 GENE.c20309_g1_i3~~c20309_g1_i3.p1  ORF type:complete len:146 (-),score=53.84 c20309_g1_i3:6-443(-)
MLNVKDFSRIASQENEEMLQKILNEKFHEIDLPDFVGKINVNQLKLGSIPPIIQLLSVSDAILSETNSENKNNEELIVDELNVRIVVAISYSGDLGFSIETELVVNNPSPRFLVLPMQFHVSNIQIEAKIAAQYGPNKMLKAESN